MTNNDYTDMINKQHPLHKLWVKIRQWAQPYYRDWSPLTKKTAKKPSTKKPAKKSTARKIKKKELANSAGVNPSANLSDVGKSTREKDGKRQSARITNISKPLDNAIDFPTKPAPGTIYSHTSKVKLQVFAHFDPQAGFAYEGRSNTARRKLKMLVYPNPSVWKKSIDRTHLIPVGFHGSESDPRLLIGWDSDVNRGKFNDFEKRQKNYSFPIYWLASVTRLKRGARWEYRVYNAESGELVDSLEDIMKCPFVWKIGD